MAHPSAIHDPLAINLRGQTRLLISSLLSDSPHASTLATAVSQTSTELLAVLSNLLASPDLTLLISTIFRPILLDLCARWLDGPQNTEQQLVALCFLFEVHEELFPCVFCVVIYVPVEVTTQQRTTYYATATRVLRRAAHVN